MTELKPGHCAANTDCTAAEGGECSKGLCQYPDSGVDRVTTQPDTGVADARKDIAVDAAVVDAAAGDALGCQESSECNGNQSLCVGGVCVECETSSDCKEPGKGFCEKGSCVGCGQAGASACGGKMCAPQGTPDAGGQCVECLDSTNCKSATAPVCEGNACVGCSSNEQCAGKNNGAAPACLKSSGECVACVLTSDCGKEGLVCDTEKHLCVGCTDSLGCKDGTPICTGGACVKCSSDSQCQARNSAVSHCTEGACVECSNSADCKDAGKPNCDPTTNKCVGCVSNANCSGTTPLCEGSVCKGCAKVAGKTCKDKDAKLPACSGDGSCVECTLQDAAACTGKKPLCNDKTNACVQCLGNSDCQDTTPICDLKTNTCVACVASTTDCQGKDPKKPACLPSGACEQCKDDSNCKEAGKTACNTTSHTCVQCVNNDRCSDPTPICDTTANTCAKCASNDQCKTKNAGAPMCRQDNGACVECLGNGDCAVPTAPICQGYACRRCNTDDECTSGPRVCMPDGHCATDAETITVSTGSNLPAVGDLSGKNLLVVNGTVSGHLNWNFTTTSRTQPMAIVGKNSGIVNGLGEVPVRVSGADVTIRNVLLTGSSSQGLRADTGGVLRLDHVRVENNRGPGILIDGVRFDIKNTTVTGNGVDGGPGIRFQNLSGLASGPKSLTLTTVSGNKDLGVSCASASDTPTQASGILVSNNATGDIGNCTFTSCSAASATCGAQP